MKRGYLSIGFFFIPQPHSQVEPIGFINHGDFYVDFAFVVVIEQRIISSVAVCVGCVVFLSFFGFRSRGIPQSG